MSLFMRRNRTPKIIEGMFLAILVTVFFSYSSTKKPKSLPRLSLYLVLRVLRLK